MFMDLCKMNAYENTHISLTVWLHILLCKLVSSVIFLQWFVLIKQIHKKRQTKKKRQNKTKDSFSYFSYTTCIQYFLYIYTLLQIYTHILELSLFIMYSLSGFLHIVGVGVAGFFFFFFLFQYYTEC